MVLLLLAALFISMAGNAQTDSLNYSAETRHDSLVAYLTPMEYAFMMHEETNWLLKVNLLVTSENTFTNTLKLSLEKKIANGFSLNAAALYRASSYKADLFSYEVDLSLESRWYYNYRNKVQISNQLPIYQALTLP